MSFIQEFKEFAIKGNAVDMAVGLIIGAAFGKVVTSLVNDIIMPPIGLAIGGVDFNNLKWVLKPAVLGPDGKETVPGVTIGYGMFLNNVIDFLIVALTIFVVIKVMHKLIAKRPLIGVIAPSEPKDIK